MNRSLRIAITLKAADDSFGPILRIWPRLAFFFWPVGPLYFQLFTYHDLCLLLTLPPTVRKQSRPQPADLKLSISAVQRSFYRISFLSSQSTTDLLSLLLVYLFLLFDVPLIVQLAKHPSCARSSSLSLLFSPRLINFAISFLPMWIIRSRLWSSIPQYIHLLSQLLTFLSSYLPPPPFL